MPEQFIAKLFETCYMLNPDQVHEIATAILGDKHIIVYGPDLEKVHRLYKTIAYAIGTSKGVPILIDSTLLASSIGIAHNYLICTPRSYTLDVCRSIQARTGKAPSIVLYTLQDTRMNYDLLCETIVEQAHPSIFTYMRSNVLTIYVDSQKVVCQIENE